MDRQPEFLNVQQTAERLQVHPNTVRNWVREGILASARIPGSRFHRFDAGDVERLRQQRGEIVASTEPERFSAGPALPDASQIDYWATVAARDAQDTFPELVRRLLIGTPGVTNISVRSGDGVALPGWDGTVDSAGSSFLPAGRICLEIGVTRRLQPKANDDYEKRRAALGESAKDVAFVFMTPRRWATGPAWASKRRAEDVFADVRVLDADDVAGWLQATPAAHHWLAEHFGRRPDDAETLEQWWHQFSRRTDPALPSGLFLAGRGEARDGLADQLGRQADDAARHSAAVVTVQAAWRDDAVAFVHAALVWIAAHREEYVAPALVVSSAEGWARVARQRGRVTLVPLFTEPDVALALEHGHDVVLPAGRDQPVGGQSLKLPAPHRELALNELKAAGVAFDDAYRLSAMARRSMPAMMRSFARDRRRMQPGWSAAAAARILAPLVLAGSWTSSKDDTDLIGRLTEAEWPNIERELRHWEATYDPPFVRSGAQWHVASREEAFLVLRDMLTDTDLERWRRAVLEVLLEPDPTIDLEPADRSVAGWHGVGRRFSSVLRAGLAEGIALLGANENTELGNTTRGTEVARDVVREVLGQANADASARTWQSIADVLPLLAEGAADEFLDAVSDDLDRGGELMRSMFQDGEDSSWLNSFSPHSSLLWALETLCWSPQYLQRAVLVLARLQAVDPGGRLGNRPIGSATSVLAGWIKHTAASLKEKLDTLDVVCNKARDDVAWSLVLGVWPSGRQMLQPPRVPVYNDWLPDDRGVPVAEWVAYIGHTVRLACSLAGADPSRWNTLAERMNSVPPDDREYVIARLREFADDADLDEEGHLLLWDGIREVVARHRQFPDADWSMDSPTLDALDAIKDKLEPTSSVERFAYLFDWRPELPELEGEDHEAQEARLDELRGQAVETTLKTASLAGVRALAERSKIPQHVGWYLGGVAPDELTPELLAWLDDDDTRLRAVASSWARRRLVDDDELAWFREMMTRPELTSMSRRAALAFAAPPKSSVWDAISEIDSELSDAYWAEARPMRVRPREVVRATRELLARGRPWAAIDLLAGDVQHPEPGETPGATRAVVEEVLSAAVGTDPGGDRSPTAGYEVGLLLDFIQREGATDEEVARFEFMFFQLLEHQRTLRALFTTLGRDPSGFVDLVCRVFRGKQEPERQLDSNELAIATHAWWVLTNWRGLPGIDSEGQLDGEHLARWVREARLALAERDRGDVGDELIGQVLSHSPDGADGLWPAEPVRSVLESIGSTDLEAGLVRGLLNSVGVTTRGVYDGGKQEWEKAARYRELARQTTIDWPRTSRTLRMLAESFERDARRWDVEAGIRADTA
jgi:hypothetical protein